MVLDQERSRQMSIIQPVRIQRKRVKGWRMPPNTVYVGRPSKWGNPWRVYDDVTNEEACEMYRGLLMNNQEFKSIIRAELRGKNIACWCRLDQPCHADILLEIANS